MKKGTFIFLAIVCSFACSDSKYKSAENVAELTISFIDQKWDGRNVPKNGQCAYCGNRFIHKIKGYSLSKSSLDLFIFATKAFYKFCNTEQDWRFEHEGVYNSKIYEKNLFVDTNENNKIITFRILFYATNRTNPLTYGIKTIYPDLTPNDGFKRVMLNE